MFCFLGWVREVDAGGWLVIQGISLGLREYMDLEQLDGEEEDDDDVKPSQSSISLVIS